MPEPSPSRAQVQCIVCLRQRREDNKRHPVIVCVFRAWRLSRKDGLDPITRHFLRITPPSQVTWFDAESEHSGPC